MPHLHSPGSCWTAIGQVATCLSYKALARVCYTVVLADRGADLPLASSQNFPFEHLGTNPEGQLQSHKRISSPNCLLRLVMLGLASLVLDCVLILM